MLFFFFSSRSRHTSWTGDWSSDVCSSDLVAVLVSGLQLGALLLATYLRGAHFHATATGIGWFVAAAGCFAVAMYSVAEIMANRIPSQEEYVGAVPAVAIVPWF